MLDDLPRRRFFNEAFATAVEEMRKEREASWSAQERANAYRIDLLARARAKEAGDPWEGPAVTMPAGSGRR